MARRCKTSRLAAGATALAIAGAALVAGGCGGSDSSSGASSHAVAAGSDGIGFVGVDQANTRQIEGSPIDASSVSRLEEAWSVPLMAQRPFGPHTVTLAATPVVSEGVVYFQDLGSNVRAIDLGSGEVIWSREYGSPTRGPNGVTVGDGTAFGTTLNAAFALDGKTGKELWSTRLAGRAEKIDMAPGYRDGVVYVSTVPGSARSFRRGGGAGVLWALDAETGRKLWQFETVPDDHWSSENVSPNSGGGLWQPPSFDAQGFVYFGTGNPSPSPGTKRFPWGNSRPGPNPYTNSIVKLDAGSGEMQWYYQQTPHDVFEWDFQNPPVLVDAGGRKLAIGSGKAGIVTAVDRGSGKPVWSTPVGVHNDHDDAGLYAMRGEFSKLQPNMAVAPGILGGVIAPAATDGETLFVPVVNGVSSVSEGVSLGERSQRTGELVALDVATGRERWKSMLPSAALGAPLVVNDLVFIPSADGVLYAFAAKGGREVWQAPLPAGATSGAMVSGDTLVAAAGLHTDEGKKAAAIVAFRLGG